MRPKFCDARSATGTEKFAWFAILKLSALNCSFMRSRKAISFTTEASKSTAPGPLAILRPAFPNCPAWVIGFRRRNDAGLIHSLTVCGPLLGLPIRSGRLAK